MKKNYVLFAAALMALASCSSDDILGGAPTAGNETSESINFAGVTGKITRASNGTSVGATAANLLGKKFYVLGTKGSLPADNPTETKVFDNYQVEWTANSAGATTSNTNDWEYVGKDFVAGLNAENHDNNAKQTIKYWDYSVEQYDFIAYSTGNATLVTGDTEVSDGKVHGTAIQTPKKNENETQQGYKSYTLKANKINDLAGCYYTDVTTVEKKDYKKPVQFTFKNLTAKVRVAFYETIPGYTVSNLQFYTDNSTEKKAFNENDNKAATLYTTNDNKLITNADITVTYPVVGKTAKDKSAPGYNKAFVIVGQEGSTTDTKLSLGNVNYVQSANVLATNAKNACMAGDSKNSYYTAVLPTATNGKPLTLRMNYTLTSEDGSNEKINVYGAKAVIPASYTQWQPNYAYTYIFKISDNTNGNTDPNGEDNTAGLFPITFDAVVADIDNNDFEHESITTVSTPSVTSYAVKDGKVVKAWGNSGVNEYPAGSDIYFSVAEDGKSLALKNETETKGTLYTIDASHTSATEAEVIDALQVPITTTSATDITGRNGVTLSKVTETTYATTIPTDDGKSISVTQNTVELLTKAKENTYAYVYLKAKGTTSYIYSAIIATNNQTAGKDEYYTDPAGKNAVPENQELTAGQIYYKKYTNNNNVYGVKVVKVVSNTTTLGE